HIAIAAVLVAAENVDTRGDNIDLRATTRERSNLIVFVDSPYSNDSRISARIANRVIAALITCSTNNNHAVLNSVGDRIAYSLAATGSTKRAVNQVSTSVNTPDNRRGDPGVHSLALVTESFCDN